MAKKKDEVVRGAEVSTDGNRAINKFRVGDAVMMIIITLLCATCVFPFLNLLAKSVSSNSAVLAKQVYFIPKGFNFDAYKSIFKDGTMVYSMIYSVIVTALFTLLGMVALYSSCLPPFQEEIKGKKRFDLPFDVPYVLWRRSYPYLPAVK